MDEAPLTEEEADIHNLQAMMNDIADISEKILSLDLKRGSISLAVALTKATVHLQGAFLNLDSAVGSMQEALNEWKPKHD